MTISAVETEMISDYEDYSDFLDSVYGDTPRRISHHAALKMAGVPVKGIMTVSAPTKNKRKYTKSSIKHYQENVQTLHLNANQIGEHTWLSTSERSLLEEFEDMPGFIRSACDLSSALLFHTIFDIDEIIKTSLSLKYSNGLRRLASMSDNMNKWKHSLSYIDFADSIPIADEEDVWIPMNIRQSYYTEKNIHKDEKYRVIWEIKPDNLFIDLLY